MQRSGVLQSDLGSSGLHSVSLYAVSHHPKPKSSESKTPWRVTVTGGSVSGSGNGMVMLATGWQLECY